MSNQQSKMNEISFIDDEMHFIQSFSISSINMMKSEVAGCYMKYSRYSCGEYEF